MKLVLCLTLFTSTCQRYTSFPNRKTLFRSLEQIFRAVDKCGDYQSDIIVGGRTTAIFMVAIASTTVSGNSIAVPKVY